MTEVRDIFENLVKSSISGSFEADLYASPLGEARLRKHPLGFAVARIASSTEQLRLHLWSAFGAEQVGFEIHNHSFDLISQVVLGSIRQRLYHAGPNPSGQNAIYDVLYQNDTSLLKKRDDYVDLTIVRDEIIPSGSQYSVSCSHLHRSDLHNCTEAITLVFTQERGNPPITVGPRDGPAELAFFRAKRQQAALREIGLSAALQSLSVRDAP